MLEDSIIFYWFLKSLPPQIMKDIEQMLPPKKDEVVLKVEQFDLIYSQSW